MSHLIILVVIHEWMLLVYLTLLVQSLEIDQSEKKVEILFDDKHIFNVYGKDLGSLISSLDEVLKNVREGDNHIKIAQDGSEISYTINIPNSGNSGGGENVNQSILDILNETLRDYVKRDEINMSERPTSQTCQSTSQPTRLTTGLRRKKTSSRNQT